MFSGPKPSPRRYQQPAAARQARAQQMQVAHPMEGVGQARSSLKLAPETVGAPAATDGDPIRSATDPRWVLAIRTAEQLEGAVLAPEKREKLIRLGRTMGLSVFDANLVIAIVQDQARRGHAADYCPTAGEAQLRMVGLPRGASLLSHLRSRTLLLTVMIFTVLVLLEVWVLRMLL